MAWHGFNNDLARFPTPWGTRDVCTPLGPRGFRQCRPRGRRDCGLTDDDWKGETGIATLLDKKTERNGDLGWTLDYATAWCYRHLISNRPEVVDTIDNIREECEVEQSLPFHLFEQLDTVLFGGRLRGMICLRWKPQWSCSPGTTSAPGVLGVPRILIQLNSALFDDNESDIDELLDALIHHMIHAYFLVCCGAQKKSEKPDGRLSDGTHFGVILLTIRDITKQCKEGILALIFHAIKRKANDNGGFLPDSRTSIRLDGSSTSSYIALDPRGCGIGPILADGQTHCLHDNRAISYHAIKNWQVNEYSRALDIDMESKGEEIHEFGADAKLTPILRVKGPPSITYAELIWDNKHIMVPREKALRFKSIKWPLKKHGRYELEIPKCDGMIFACIYDFINKNEYGGSEKVVWDAHTMTQRLQPHSRPGPPVIVTGHHMGAIHHPGAAVKHIKVFKVAEKIKFEELMRHALGRLWEMPLTSDDPLEILKLLYDDHHDTQPGPIHSELHKWSRAFLSKTDESLRPHGPATVLLGGLGAGISNLQKIKHAQSQELRELLRRSSAFEDDFNLARADLLTKQVLPRTLPPAALNGSFMPRTLMPAAFNGSNLPQQRLQPLDIQAPTFTAADLLPLGNVGGMRAINAAPVFASALPAWQQGIHDQGHIEEMLQVPVGGNVADWVGMMHL